MLTLRLSILLATATVLALACSSSKTPEQTPAAVEPTATAAATVTSTATVETASSVGAVSTDLDCGALPDIPLEACEFSEEVAHVAVTRDADRLAELLQERDYECPDPEEPGMGGPYPLCDGADQGEHREGYSIANDVVRFAVSRAQLADLALFLPPAPSTSDEFGDSRVRLFTIGCPLDEGVSCAESFVVVMSGIPFNLRTIHFLVVERDVDSDLYQISRITSIGLPPIGRAEWLTGGEPPQGFADPSEFFYYRVN